MSDNQQSSIEGDEIIAQQIQDEENAQLIPDEVVAQRMQAEEDALVERPDDRNQEQNNSSLGAAAEGGRSNDDVINGTLRESSSNYVGSLLKRPVPADNSCLFSSIRFVLSGGHLDSERSHRMRHQIAHHISANPEQYNDAILGMTNASYCSWIKHPNTWGGAIEVSIISNFNKVEIDVIDMENGIINRFGEDKNYKLRVFLLFDGIHFDPLYMKCADGDTIATMFPINDMSVYQLAERLVTDAKTTRRYKNKRLALRCLQCGMEFIGQEEALQHAQQNNHSDFREI